MKKVFMYVLIFMYVLVLLKFYFSDYDISYEMDGYDITEKANGDYIYFEVNYNDTLYNYMFYMGRKLFKKRVKKIEVTEVNDYICLTPSINGMDVYSVCNNGKEYVSSQIANDEIVSVNSNDNFKYYENLKNDEHVYIWKYDGFYYLNGDKLTSINIFNNDRYSTDLMFSINGYLIFPRYDSNYLFSDFVILDMSNGKYEFVSTDYKINYDSYYVGNVKSSVFLFDNKEEKLYEINYKKGKAELVGNENKGFIKYKNGKKTETVLEEYTNDKITYFEDNVNYNVVDKNFLSYVLNEDIKLKFYNDENINVVDSVNSNIYFIFGTNLLRYNNDGASVIASYFEFNFNSKNNVFVYNE